MQYLTISINDGVIKLAQAASSGNIEKIACGNYAPTGGADEAAVELKKLLSSFNRKASVLCMIPANVATAKTIEVPSNDPEEIKSIINLQASRHTPYSREEVLISYINLGTNASNNTALLLVIVHRDVVKERISILEKAGLDTDSILFVSEAQARFYAKSLGLKKESPAMGLVDFTANAASFIVVSKGTLFFVRNIPIGTKTLSAGGDAAAKFQEEFKKSMEAFTQEDGGQPPSLYAVTSGHEAVGAILPSLEAALQVKFKVSPYVNLIKTSGGLRKRLTTEFGDDSFLDVAAPASTAGKCEVNLMPDEMIMKKTVERQSREASKAGVSAVIIMVLVGALLMTNIYFKYTFLNKNLIQNFAPQHSQVKALEEQMGKVKLVRGYIQERMVSLDVIHELYNVTPHSIYLNNISMDQDGTIIIDGISDSMSDVFSYVKSLNDSSMFKDAKTKSTATKKDNGKDVAAFQIEFKLGAMA
jgi:Tfp pilus assembly protein PilN